MPCASWHLYYYIPFLGYYVLILKIKGLVHWIDPTTQFMLSVFPWRLFPYQKLSRRRRRCCIICMYVENLVVRMIECEYSMFRRCFFHSTFPNFYAIIYWRNAQNLLEMSKVQKKTQYVSESFRGACKRRIGRLAFDFFEAYSK